jgi:hypothetical protein
MTELEYKRWKNFSIRMAWRGYSRVPRKSKVYLTNIVKDFFRHLDGYLTINETLPVNIDPKWGMDFADHQSEFLRDRIKSWDGTESHPTWRDRYGHSTNGPYICDIVSEWIDNWAEGNTYDEDVEYRRWDNLWGSRIRSCIRAGMDCAVGPSMGVMGFTAGDLRRMYRGKVPYWVMGTEPLEVHHFVGVIPGVGLVPGEAKTNGVFSSVPDEVGVWL